MVTDDPKVLLRYWGNLTLGDKRVKLLNSLCKFKNLSPKQKNLVVILSNQMNEKFKPYGGFRYDYNDWLDAPYAGDI